MSGGKGGSQTTQVEIPKYIEDASRANIAQGKEISQIGYVPYYGPDIAAFNPMQAAAMQSAADFGSAFGLMPQMDAMAGMPQAQTFEGGIRGYSSAPLYEQAVAELAARRPGQAALINKQFVNPYGTGTDVTEIPGFNDQYGMIDEYGGYGGGYGGGDFANGRRIN
jgi:hypothetical protein